MFQVQEHICASCIYRPDSPLDLKKLEDACRDPHMDDYFVSYRVCHHASDAKQDKVCCAGFWAAHKDAFTMGQLAQRMGWVEKVTVL